MAVDKNKIGVEATRFAQKGQFDKALRAYAKILDQDPDDVRVLLKVGEIHQKKGDIPSAADVFGRVAEAYASQGFFLKAVAVYKQMSKLTPGDVRVNERLAALYQQLGLASDALGQLHVVAGAAEKAGEEAKHVEALRKIVELDPENVPSAVKLGDLYLRQQQPSLAIELFRRAAEQLKQSHRVDEYVKVAERLVALVPGERALARELARLLLERGETKRALAKLQVCFKGDPGDVETLTLLAQAFQNLGQVAKTVSVYRELARIHEASGAPAEARDAWERALELAPDDPDALAALQAPGEEEVPTPTPSPPPAPPAPSPSPVTTSASASGAPSPSLHGAPSPSPSPPRGEREVSVASAATSEAEKLAKEAEKLAKCLSDADVYLKYGLHDRALEQVRKVLAAQPGHLDAWEKSCRVHELRGEKEAAAGDALRLAELALSAGAPDRARAALARARELAPAHPGLAALEPRLRGPAAGAADAAGRTAHPQPAARGAAVAVEPTPLAGAPVLDLEALAPTPPGVSRHPPADDDLAHDLAEVDFFLEQGLVDEARDLLHELRASHAADPRIEAKLRQVERRAAPAS
jgi:tetratricopeptide (TPR) repeat protein